MIINSVIAGGGSSAPAHYIERGVDANGKLIISVNNFIDLTGVTDMASYVLQYAYNRASFPEGMIADMSSIITISGSNALENTFSSTTGIAGVNFSSLTTISGVSAFYFTFAYNHTIANIDFPSLTTITGSNVFSSTFLNSYIKTVKMNKLNVVSQPISPTYAPMFGGSSYLESVEFGGLTAATFTTRQDQLAYLFNNNTGTSAPNGCTVHFPSNFDPSDPNHTFDASTLTGYPTFGGSASYIHVAFDLPATE